MKRTITYLAAAVAAALLSGHAQAATAIDLQGDISAFNEFQQDFGGLHFDQFLLTLTGLDNSNAFTVSQGDEVDATVSLNGLLTVPLSKVRTDLIFYLFGTGFSGSTGMHGVLNFYDGAVLVNSFGYSSGSTGQLAGFAAVFPPDNGAFSFDSFTATLLIDTLSSPVTLNGSGFQYALVSNAVAVPEPATWAMMLLGFGLLGAGMRSRRRRSPAPV
jgi:hypothetical protein